jgi:Uma2 family endonuclease
VNGDSNLDLGDPTWRPAPDLFIVDREAWVNACRQDRYVSQPPLLAIEIVSPANAPGEVNQKRSFYLDHGVEQVWVVYPHQPSIDVYAGQGHVSVTQGSLALPGSLLCRILLSDIFQFPEL